MDDMLGILARRSFAASRVRNLIAVLAIALTAALFTAVTSIGLGTMESFTLTLQMQKMSRSDGDIRYMTAEQFEAMRQADFIEKAGLRIPVGFLTNARRHNIEFDVEDETQAKLTFAMPTHGSIPKAANEVVASSLALRDLGVTPEEGAEFTIEFTAHGQDYCIPVALSGWYEALDSQISVMWAGTAFRDAHPDIFQYTFHEDGDITGTYFSDFTVYNTFHLEEKLQELAYGLGGQTENMDKSGYLQVVVNRVANANPSIFQITVVLLFMGLFMLCGSLLIYNVFDIAVMQDIRRFGLYRVIGMGQKQMRSLIGRQVFWLGCMGMPFGLLAGFFIGKGALPLIMGMVATEYKNLAADVSPSPLIFLTASALTVVTVFFSTRKPIRAAANMPPVEMFRYTETHGGRRSSRKSALCADLSRLAWFNLGRNRGRTALILLSLMLCVVLLNCAGTAAGSVDVEKETAFMIRTDFSVVNIASASNAKGFIRRSDALRDKTIADIAARPGVTGGGAVYKNTAEDADVSYDFGHTLTNNTFVNDASGLSFAFDENNNCFGLGNDGRPICNVYGLEETALARMDLREGEKDAHALYEKMSGGGGVLVGVDVNRMDMSVMPELDLVDVGQVITVYKDGRAVMELPVLSKAALNGDDEEIGYTTNGPKVIGGDGLFLYLPVNIYEMLYDDPTVYKYAFDVEDGYEEEMTAFLEDYMENEDPEMNYLSARTARENSEGTRDMIRFVGGLVGLIFGIAGALNLINTIVTTILARRHEFATMESVGMTKRQLTEMMVYESVYYAAGAWLLGILTAAALNVTLLKGVIDSMWQFTFRFTLVPGFMAGVVLLLVSVAVPVVSLCLFHKGSIVEQLRVAD